MVSPSRVPGDGPAVDVTYQMGGDRFAIERRDLEMFGIYDPV